MNLDLTIEEGGIVEFRRDMFRLPGNYLRDNKNLKNVPGKMLNMKIEKGRN
ncbi:MAG: hypothetical protein LBP39_01965 [Rickettsiales bacterium]|nr:hypothetical protein [Rickettsiales bacterium]